MDFTNDVFPTESLIPATGFYEYTAPEKPKVKLKDRHLFTILPHRLLIAKKLSKV